MVAGIDPARLNAVFEREYREFVARTPKSAALIARARDVMPDGVPMAWMAGLFAHPPICAVGGEGSAFEDADGNRYIDFNLADLSNTIGYGPTAVSRLTAETAARGVQYLMPSEDAIAVAEELKRRTGFRFWQYTLSASQANTEIIRIARAMTGRQKVVVFQGKYHGHLDTTLAEDGPPDALGLAPASVRDTVVIPFNDPDALRAALAGGDVALVMTEPALTNCTLVIAEPGFLTDAHALSRAAGTLFAFDETHTWQFAYGGLAPGDGLTADFLCLGKGLGTGVAFACYGMTAEIGAFVEDQLESISRDRNGLAIGGTLFGNALSVSATRAGLDEILTEEGYARLARLGTRLADGLDGLIARHGLPWRSFRLGPRAGFCLTPEAPRNYTEAKPSLDRSFSAARRLFMANRGIWEAIISAAPQVGFAHEAADIDRYVEVAGAFLDDVTGA
ncbi:aminotransferase class III-fold pyridoxal phosphate-dependent enzyme [Defluviimonas sp. WL0050]|uniref:Aminotransferase class III-fold pyridoxal phosphate-dependent enzyme n=1 Tax=Albidovulum litorale TaxID=2984134 RepID=A0ABT2ZSE8_9RHOB|nr:aminotransferase class III-fold pyridoxal phosphate-dependent enzyme [Defluviimonas sp. WL0050]MCV2873967.1 aminotransferase class III-fold pyridoxal phosphate-dependent enzyme [Defluviimonas sp. WL0050]